MFRCLVAISFVATMELENFHQNARKSLQRMLESDEEAELGRENGSKLNVERRRIQSIKQSPKQA